MNAKSWNLLDDGLLWKRVIEGAADPEFPKQAKEFIAELQQAARPKNALEGLLLDRMASSYLRKVMLLEVEAGFKKFARARTETEPKGSTREQRQLSIIPFSFPTAYPQFIAMLKHESMLDQSFHRDTFLLQQLQDVSEKHPALPPKKSAKANGKDLEAGTKKPEMGTETPAG